MIEIEESARVLRNSGIPELTPAYLKRREGDVELLRRYIGTLDFSAIQGLAHKLSGNGGMFGFERISEIGADLELAAIDRSLPRVQAKAQEFSDYLATIETPAQGEK